MCGDLLLTGGTVFWLLVCIRPLHRSSYLQSEIQRHSNVVLPRGQTARMLDSLLRLTIQVCAR
jgi:hypothetical protein